MLKSSATHAEKKGSSCFFTLSLIIVIGVENELELASSRCLKIPRYSQIQGDFVCRPLEVEVGEAIEARRSQPAASQFLAEPS